MKEHTKCIICEENKSDRFIKVSDRLSQNLEYFELVKCKCDFIYLNPRPDSKEIVTYYKSTNYNPHNKFSNTLWTQIYKFVQSITLKWKYNKIHNFISHRRLLDIGGGNGEFAKYMVSQGWHVVMQDKVSNISSDNNSYQFIQNLNGISRKQSFDVITLWHSLEHIHNIKKLFDNINHFLTNEGILLIAVPNIQAPERKRLGGKYWQLEN